MKVIFHEDFYKVYTGDPAAAPGRIEAVMEVISSKVEIIQAKPALEEDIATVHTSEHIQRVRNSGLYEISALAAGGAIQAALIGLKEPAFGLIRPPGHHASSGSSWGFCYFNNMAIALEHLRKANQIKRAYVLDIDLHYGDGTVNILGNRDDVTIHNVDTCGRKRYMDEVAHEMKTCEADIIGISAGFDNHELDWGGTLTTNDYYEIGRLVRQAAGRYGGGCFAVLEGGYNHEILGENVLALIKGLDDSVP
ncbi:MAG: histone deacetylase family protein [Deltaproteobacteria bacterium]|nr:histone deacetylase family protein [Deltaproteobacteria bacterium]